MKNWILFFFLLSLSANVYGQEKLIIMNAVGLDTTRYDEYIGSPYFLEDWTNINIISVGGVRIDNVKGNFNGLDGEWEIFHEGKFTKLPASLYTEIEVTFDESQKYSDEYPPMVTFSSKAHPKFKDKYIIVLIDNPKLRLYEEFYAVEHENKKETPGKTMTTKTIKRKSIYKIEYRDQLHDLKANKKGLSNVFGDKKLIEKQLSKSKNKLKTSKELTAFINEMLELDLLK